MLIQANLNVQYANANIANTQSLEQKVRVKVNQKPKAEVEDNDPYAEAYPDAYSGDSKAKSQPKVTDSFEFEENDDECCFPLNGIAS